VPHVDSLQSVPHVDSLQSVSHVDTSRPKLLSGCPRQTRDHLLSGCVANRTVIGRSLCDTNCVSLCHCTVNRHDDIIK
jgi:hypothetical protein